MHTSNQKEPVEWFGVNVHIWAFTPVFFTQQWRKKGNRPFCKCMTPLEILFLLLLFMVLFAPFHFSTFYNLPIRHFDFPVDEGVCEFFFLKFFWPATQNPLRCRCIEWSPVEASILHPGGRGGGVRPGAGDSTPCWDGSSNQSL